MTGQAPKLTLRDGTLSVALWENTDNSGNKWKSITIKKSYKRKGSETWENTNKIPVNNVGKLIEFLQRIQEEAKQ